MLSLSNIKYTNHLYNYFSFYFQTKIFIYLNYLEGNEVNRFLANIDKMVNIISLQFFAFIKFFKDMENMMKSVFGYTSNTNHKDVISRLRNSFEVIHKRFQVLETVKIHIMLVHVEQFIYIKLHDVFFFLILLAHFWLVRSLLNCLGVLKKKGCLS